MILDTSSPHQKIRAEHLRRNAYLYVRQSTLRQVFENTESTQRQYALKERAVALGWAIEDIVVIDSDQGQSGASTDREGFQRLVTEVGMGRAGIVMGLEVSRLARNSSDWHRLLEICALSQTLILDEDGIYDPAHFNDRLLLGLKGTMSEAELHVLRARLIGGIFNKARRGELQAPLPVGLVYDALGRVGLEPDQQVQESLKSFFATFRRVGSASGVVREFRTQGLLFPRSIRSGPHKGEIGWGPLGHWRVLQVLHNPRYAGAFAWGRHEIRRKADGSTRNRKLPREEWFALIPDLHPGYISWEEYEENQRRLLENAAARGEDRRRSPPREGPALLQGLVLCGRCGLRMTVRYRYKDGNQRPEYVCQRDGIHHARPICQSIPGEAIDARIGDLLIEKISPKALHAALSVQDELLSRLSEADRLRHLRVERARYEADAARGRYMRVQPDNRLVADALEADWNARLRDLANAQEVCEREGQADRQAITNHQREQILGLASSFPKLWTDPRTPNRERKRMVRLLIDDVTLIKAERVNVNVRFRGGATCSLSLPLARPAWVLRQTAPDVVAAIDELLDYHCDKAIACLLNERGLLSGEGRPFNKTVVRHLRTAYQLKSRRERLRARGMLTAEEIATLLDVTPATIKRWRRAELLTAHVVNDKGECLYEPPGADAPVRNLWKGVATFLSLRETRTDPTDEVQYEA